MDECVICGSLAIHSGLCCVHKYDEQPDCLLCPSATLVPDEPDKGQAPN